VVQRLKSVLLLFDFIPRRDATRRENIRSAHGVGGVERAHTEDGRNTRNDDDDDDDARVVVIQSLIHGFRTTWKRDDDDVDTVRDGKREPVSMVRDATTINDDYDYSHDDRRGGERRTTTVSFLSRGGSLGGRGKKRR